MASTEKQGTAEYEGQRTMFQGKNIHSSPVDGKLLCSFSEKTCMQRRLNQYAFCIRHVLEDKNAPFKQCKFVAKYNGQRCTNAIPVKEERVYCNSHLQVLGIVPKKSRKKKALDNTDNKPITKMSEGDNILPQNTASKRIGKACVSQRPTSDERNVKKAKVLSSNPLLHKLVNTYSKENDQNDLFSYYGFCSSDEESETKDLNIDFKPFPGNSCSKVTENSSSSKSPRTIKLWQLRQRLRSEMLGIENSIAVYKKDVKQSSKALDLLLTSVKASPSLTAIAIRADKESYSVRSRKRSATRHSSQIFCTTKIDEVTKCEQKALPYTKYCSLHITNDSKQVLFQPCSSELSSGEKCMVPSFNLINQQILCQKHSTTQISPPRSSEGMPDKQQNHVAETIVGKPSPKKARRKPQAKTLQTPKPSKKTTKKESHRAIKCEKNKKINSVMVGQPDTKNIVDNHGDHIRFVKSPPLSSSTATRAESVDYLSNGNLKIEPLCSGDEMSVFSNNEFKGPDLFENHDMEVDGSLENDVLNMPEDLGDISPTGMLRHESVLKLPLDLTENPSVKQHGKSPIEVYSIENAENLHKQPSQPVIKVEVPRKQDQITSNKQFDVPGHQMNRILKGARPTRSTVITLPKFFGSANMNAQRQNVPVSNAEYNSFAPIAANIVKSEPRKPEIRPLEVNHAPTLFPVQFDTVLNPTVAWGTTGGKFLINNRSRPLLINAPINHASYSPSPISPHISPQITLGSAFNFDRPTVLQHSNSSSPTLTAYNSTLPNSPHGKLVAPRTIRLDNRGNVNPNEMIDPFFGATFDKL